MDNRPDKCVRRVQESESESSEGPVRIFIDAEFPFRNRRERLYDSGDRFRGDNKTIETRQ
jgi:hypothetical protein